MEPESPAQFEIEWEKPPTPEQIMRYALMGMDGSDYDKTMKALKNKAKESRLNGIGGKYCHLCGAREKKVVMTAEYPYAGGVEIDKGEKHIYECGTKVVLKKGCYSSVVDTKVTVGKDCVTIAAVEKGEEA